jgi:hypothetical protein
MRRLALGICINSVIAMLTCVVLLNTGGSANAAGWSDEVTIVSIEVSNVNAAGIWLRFAARPFSSNPCSSNNGQYILAGGTANISQMATIANLALVNSRAVTVYGSGCSLSYPALVGITIK